MLENPWLSSKTMLSLYTFLQRGDDFLRHHQVRAVAHQHVHVAFGMRHLYPQASRDFVAHAGIAILHVITAGLARAPEFVQVSGHAPGGADHNVRRPGKIVDDADDFRLRNRGILRKAVDAIHFFFPITTKAGDLAPGNCLQLCNPATACCSSSSASHAHRR